MARQTVRTPVMKRIASMSSSPEIRIHDMCLDFRIIFVPLGYNKLLVPPAVGGKSKLELNMSVILVNILEIDIVGGLFRTRHVLDRQWFDPLLTYRNLDKDYRINLISEEEQEQVWFPKLVFVNELSEDDTLVFKYNQEYALVRNPENKFDPIGVEEIDNMNIYAGDINKLYLRKDFVTVWMCEFNMKWYPFDTQECSMQYKVVNRYSDFATLVIENLSYAGPEDLTEYKVKGYRMCYVKLGQQIKYDGVEVKVTLGRPLISNILIVFIPCIILLTICHLANVFDKDYLDMVIGVNLTALLVLGTL